VLPPSYASFVEARRDGAFTSVSDLAGRAPELHKAEMVALVQIGALNSIDETRHRRDELLAGRVCWLRRFSRAESPVCIGACNNAKVAHRDRPSQREGCMAFAAIRRFFDSTPNQ